MVTVCNGAKLSTEGSLSSAAFIQSSTSYARHGGRNAAVGSFLPLDAQELV